MTRAGSGLGDLLYLGGVDVSGDVGVVDELSSPISTVDTTSLAHNAAARQITNVDGVLNFSSWFNPTGAHPILAALPLSDVIATYVHGAAATAPAAGLQARQPDYAPSKATSGALAFRVALLGDATPIEWGIGYVGGSSRTDTTATAGSGVDDTKATSSGLSAYLHVLAFTGTTATILIEHSNDNGATDTWTTVMSFAAVTAAPVAQRVTTNASPTKRWLRVRTSGTFSSLKFYVMASRLAGLIFVSAVTVDVQIFTASGTWTKPTGGQTASFIAALGGGGGGGQGFSDFFGGVAYSGGAGGGGAGYVTNFFLVANLAATESVTVGAGGLGDTTGSGGSDGGFSQFGTIPKLVAFSGGGAGQGGASPGTAGKGGLSAQNGSAGSTSVVGGVPLLAVSNSTCGGTGGGAGGGVNAAGTGFSGSNGGQSNQVNQFGGIAGATSGVAGHNGFSVPANSPVGGTGAGGGAGGTGGTDGGKGGIGGSYGAGGGGGGASATGNPGNGGNGGVGFVLVVSW